MKNRTKEIFHRIFHPHTCASIDFRAHFQVAIFVDSEMMLESLMLRKVFRARDTGSNASIKKQRRAMPAVKIAYDQDLKGTCE